MRKSVFGGSDQVQQELGCAVRLEISDLESREIVLIM